MNRSSWHHAVSEMLRRSVRATTHKVLCRAEKVKICCVCPPAGGHHDRRLQEPVAAVVALHQRRHLAGGAAFQLSFIIVFLIALSGHRCQAAHEQQLSQVRRHLLLSRALTGVPLGAVHTQYRQPPRRRHWPAPKLAILVQVLRRHLLFSRALTAVPLGAVEGVPPHRLDDQAVAVVAAKALQSRPWHTCVLLPQPSAKCRRTTQLQVPLAACEAYHAKLCCNTLCDANSGVSRAARAASLTS